MIIVLIFAEDEILLLSFLESVGAIACKTHIYHILANKLDTPFIRYSYPVIGPVVVINLFEYKTQQLSFST